MNISFLRRKKNKSKKRNKTARGKSKESINILKIGKNYELDKFLKKLKTLSPLTLKEKKRLKELNKTKGKGKGKGKKRRKKTQRGG